MNAEVFERYLRLQLCWLDGFPTVGSHLGQRQCPHCRWKWSYAALGRQWALAREFCKGNSRGAAAGVAGMEAHAAGRHYAAFRDALATHFVATARSSEDGFYADPTRLAAACRSAAKIPEKKRRLRVLVELCLWEMKEEARVELLFRLVFREPLRRRVRRALASRLGGRGGSVVPGVDFGAADGAASGEDVLG